MTCASLQGSCDPTTDDTKRCGLKSLRNQIKLFDKPKYLAFESNDSYGDFTLEIIRNVANEVARSGEHCRSCGGQPEPKRTPKALRSPSWRRRRRNLLIELSKERKHFKNAWNILEVENSEDVSSKATIHFSFETALRNETREVFREAADLIARRPTGRLVFKS